MLTGLAGVLEVLPRWMPRGLESPLLELSASFLAFCYDFYLLKGLGDFRPESPLAFAGGSTSSYMPKVVNGFLAGKIWSSISRFGLLHRFFAAVFSISLIAF